MRSTVHADAAFVKYAESGAYHWARWLRTDRAQCLHGGAIPDRDRSRGAAARTARPRLRLRRGRTHRHDPEAVRRHAARAARLRSQSARHRARANDARQASNRCGAAWDVRCDGRWLLRSRDLHRSDRARVVARLVAARDRSCAQARRPPCRDHADPAHRGSRRRQPRARVVSDRVPAPVRERELAGDCSRVFRSGGGPELISGGRPSLPATGVPPAVQPPVDLRRCKRHVLAAHAAATVHDADHRRGKAAR